MKLKSLLINYHKKTAALGNFFVKTRRVITIWNYNVTMRLLYANFEICKLCMLFALVVFAYLMCLIINQWVKIQDLMLSLKKLVSFKYQIIVLLNLKKVSNRDLTINKRNQRISFCNTVVLKVFDIAKEFAMDKGQKSCFLIGEKLYIYYLLQNSFQFKSLKEIGKALVRNLKRFSGSNNANLSQIVIFNKVTNLFTLKTPDLGTFDLDISCYIAFNCILSYFKKLSI